MIDLDISDGIATVTLNDPGRRNALGVAAAAELVRACERIDSDAMIGGVILRGAGAYFCSGGDRADLAAASAAPLSETGSNAISAIYEAFLRVGRLGVPTVAAIRGGAVGAGMNLALACDVRIVGDSATLASGFARLGVHPGGGHFALLTRAMGHEAAFAVGVLGKALRGREIVEHRLAFACVADEEVEAHALDLLAPAGEQPDLARATVASARLSAGPPALAWPVALEVERMAQARTLAAKGSEGWESRARAINERG